MVMNMMMAKKLECDNDNVDVSDVGDGDNDDVGDVGDGEGEAHCREADR